MSLAKILLIGGLVIVVILAIGIYYLFSSLDGIVKSAVESYGTEVVGSKVTVAEVKISLQEGKGTLKGITIANPPGFSSEPAFSLQEVTLDLDINSISSNPFIVEDVRVISPHVRVETDAQGKTNLDVLAKKIQSSGDSTGNQKEASSSDLRMRIKQFIFEDGTIKARIPQQEQEMEVKLPALRMNEIGGSDGQPPEVVGQVVMNKFAQECIKVVTKKGAELLIEKKLDEKTGGAAKKVLDAILQ